MADSLRRVRVTRGTRISDLGSPLFQTSSPTNRGEQERLVRATKRVARAFEDRSPKVLKPEEAAALTDELLVCLGSDLQLCEWSEVFWGITVPDMELDLEQSPSEWHKEAAGLLVYRAWQLLTRTPSGRRTLVDSQASRPASELEDVDYDSYSLIHGVIARELHHGTITDFFRRCVRNLEASATGLSSELKPCITPTEQRSICSALDNRELDWVRVHSAM